MDEKKTELDIEWEKRILCSDGSCIGVIGPDGNCKECGTPYDGVLPEMTALAPDVSIETENSASANGADDTDSHDAEDVDAEWENRQLCSDGNCIGVIGSDGNCKECGKPFEA